MVSDGFRRPWPHALHHRWPGLVEGLRRIHGWHEGLVLRNDGVSWPLSWRRNAGLTVVEMLGQDFRSSTGPLCVGDAQGTSLHPDDLPEPADVADFRRLPEECLGSLLPSVALRLARPDVVHFDRDLEGSVEAFMASLSSGAKKELRYCRNRADKTMGESALRFETVPVTPGNWEETRARAMAMAPYSWQAKSGQSVLVNEGKKHFLMHVMQNGLPLFFHFLHFGDAIAALALTIRNSGQILVYSHEYNSEFSKFRPGYLLNQEIITEAIGQGVSRLDFGVGEAPHKHVFRCRPKQLWRLILPLTWKGRVAVAYQKARWLAGELLHRKTAA